MMGELCLIYNRLYADIYVVNLMGGGSEGVS
jgi:hypothetical protein